MKTILCSLLLSGTLLVRGALAEPRRDIRVASATGQSAVNPPSQVYWYQAEAIRLTVAFDADTNAAYCWTVVSATNPAQAYIAVTGAVESATNAIFALSPSNSNLAAGSYVGYVIGMALSGATVTSQVVVSRQAITVRYSPDSRFYAYVGPLTYSNSAWPLAYATFSTQAVQGAAAYAWGNHATNGYVTLTQIITDDSDNFEGALYVGSGDHRIHSTANGALDIQDQALFRSSIGAAALSDFTESDPVWAAASNATSAAIANRLASNAWAAADSTTNSVRKTGDTMIGTLRMRTRENDGRIEFYDADSGWINGDADYLRLGYSHHTNIVLDWTGAMNMFGNPITNAYYFGDGGGLTNLTELDPVWAAASNATAAAIAARLASNAWAAADSTTNAVRKTGDTMTGDVVLDIGENEGAGNFSRRLGFKSFSGTGYNTNFLKAVTYGGQDDLWFDGSLSGSYQIMSDGNILASRMTNSLDVVYLRSFTESDPLWAAASNATAAAIAARIASNAWAAADSTTNYVPRNATNVALGLAANGADYGSALGRDANGSAYGVSLGASSKGVSGGVGIGYQANGSDSGTTVGRGANAYYLGTAVGRESKGSWFGVGVGYLADGSATNIAIGYSANAAGGTRRIAIGENTTNMLNNTAAIRGNLCLDGGTSLSFRATFGAPSNTWINAVSVDAATNVHLGGSVIYDDTSWDDLTVSAFTLNTGGGAPAKQAYGTNGTYAMAYNSGDGGLGVVQLRHGTKRFSAIAPHIHWSCSSGSRTSAWSLVAAYGSIGNVLTNYYSASIAATTTAAYVHSLGSFPPFGSNVLSESAIVMFTISCADDGGTDNQVFLHDLDFHYQMDRPGTRNEIPD